MSKERLEEIKEQFKYLQGDFMQDDIGWLIEQAERAEESERQMFTIVENTEKSKSMLNFKIKLLEKQNKRYRERVAQLINYIEMTDDETDRQVHKIHVILDGLLEGEE